MKKYFLLLIISVIFLPKLALAYTAVLNVDTNSNSINAIEGTIQIPKDISITKIYDGNSVLVFWVDKPTLDKSTNTIRFSGFTPGGFQGVWSLFSLEGNFNEQDLNRFTFQGVRALENDGQGTAVSVKLTIASTIINKDTTSPEVFVSEISKSPEVFDNLYFLSFVTQDKGMGIDHYEYAATRFFSPSAGEWKPAESPFVLNKSELSKRIFIKAIDKSGNERISTLFGPKYFEYTFIGFIIGVLILCVLSYILKMFL